MMRNKYVLPWKDLVFRLGRAEGTLRGFNFFYFMGTLGALSYLKGEYYDPVFTAPKKAKEAEELEALDARAREMLFYNRFGAPTRPTRSMDEMMAFLAGSKTFDDLADFLSYDGSMSVNTDALNGLDSWMSDQDKTMMSAYRAQAKGAKH